MASDDAKLFAALSHGLGLLVGIIPALIIWLIKKDEDAFIAEHSKEALNFQITVAIAAIIAAILIIVLIGIILLPIIGIIFLVFTIIATVKAAQGEDYRYPFALRLVK